ncbi:MAG TPA: TetR/AcrR family transcriptional regulator [Polyangiaceae bacterium]|nr:TetR/AcrR family transcriptional regulator [Polyangiaceae bacterium]
MPRPKSDIDVRILHAARQRFLAEGVDGASLRSIAKDAHTSIGMVYYYFPTKDDLFLAVVEEVYERVLADLSDALSFDLPVTERIRQLYERLGRIDDEEQLVLRLVVREALVSSTRLDRLFARFQRGHIPLVLRAVSDGVQDGTLSAERHPLLLVAALVAFGTVPQVFAKVLASRLPLGSVPEGAELANELVDLLFKGIGPRVPT